MALRFQTRLTLMMSGLLFFVFTIMGLFVVWMANQNAQENYRRFGESLTVLTTRNMDYGVSLPDKVMERVGDQMVVSALLTAEFVAVAEGEAGLNADEISARLRRVVERSGAGRDTPRIDEFWVTDENGRIYIGTKPSTFTFSPDGKTNPQASEFWPLLEGSQAPVVQDFMKRDEDDQRFKYVGVGGVDKARIVQVGAGEQLIASIQKEFSPQTIVDRFMNTVDFAAMALVDDSGTILASAVSRQARQDVLPLSGELASHVARFLRERPEAFMVVEIGPNIGVVTRLMGQDNRALGLFILHDTAPGRAMLRANITKFTLLSIAMFLLAVLVCVRLSRRFSRPISDLAVGVGQFGNGNFDHRVSVKSHDELEALADSFNTMASSLQDYMDELQRETTRRERLESELAIAAELQRSLLPVDPPVVEGLTVQGLCRPAREVGGDFYDVLDMGAGRLGIAVGDATGKGLSAAMLITECWSAFKALAVDDLTPSQLLTRTNRMLCRSVGDSGRFVTLFFAVIDVPRGVVQYSMAGHNPPLLVGADASRRHVLKSEYGIPLGVSADASFEDVTIELMPEDTLLLFSDGLSEARSSDHRLYGEDRVFETFCSLACRPLNEVIDGLRRDADLHMNGSELDDDMTIVAVRFCPSGSAAQRL